ncbi:hypothetical protein ACFTWS_26385 [Streptomyces sp. NPDC057027]|uniref:hypothetical protein n=1 Tax=Streptomyces sp. NPDC057027 TaxID=3346004 RepID=UPI003628E590
MSRRPGTARRSRFPPRWTAPFPWDPGDHSVRHDGERPWGKVYPVTLAPDDGSTVLRWAIPPHHDEDGGEP